MKYCIKCGAQLKDDAQFCNKCGAQCYEEPEEKVVSDNKPEASESGSVKNSTTDGVKVPDSNAKQPSDNPQKPNNNKSKTPLIIALIVAGLIIVGLLVYIFVFKPKTEEKPADIVVVEESMPQEEPSQEEMISAEDVKQDATVADETPEEKNAEISPQYSTPYEGEWNGKEWTLNITKDGELFIVDYQGIGEYNKGCSGSVRTKLIGNDLTYGRGELLLNAEDPSTVIGDPGEDYLGTLSNSQNNILVWNDLYYAYTGEISEYILPQSDQRLLSDADLGGFGWAAAKMARNEIFARHNRKFKDEELQSYFNNCVWYSGTIEPDAFNESVLSSIEKDNINFLKSFEEHYKALENSKSLCIGGSYPGTLPEDVIMTMRRSLGIPDEALVLYEAYNPYYWESGEMTVMSVWFTGEDNYQAGATFDVDTFEPVKEILTWDRY